MATTYTSTNRFFIETPYLLEPDTNKTPLNSQQIINYLSTTDREKFEIEGNIIIGEYIVNGKYNYHVIAFPHDIWTPTGKITKYLKKCLENKSFIDDHIPSNLSETTYENWESQHA